MGSFVATGPDGGLYEFTIQGSAPTPEELASINKKLGYAPTTIPTSGSGMGSFEAGFRGAGADLSTALAKLATGIGAPEAGKSIYDYAQSIRERTAREYKPRISEFGQISGLGDFLNYLANTGGQSLGYMAPSLLGSAAAALAAPAVGIGGTAAATAGMAAASLPSFFGSNIQEQIETNKVGLAETETAPALGAAVAQTALDIAPAKMFGVLSRIGGLAGKKVLAPEAQAIADNTWATFIKELPPRAAKAALAEAGTETLQEALAVFQANPDKLYNLDAETANRFANAAFGGLVLGGGMSLVGRSENVSDTKRLDDLGRRLETEGGAATADIRAAREAWNRLANIDRGALLKDEEAARLEREADDLLGVPPTFDMIGEGPIRSFSTFAEDIMRSDEFAPKYSIGARGARKPRVALTFMQKAEPFANTSGLDVRTIRMILGAGISANKNAEGIFTDLFRQAQATQGQDVDIAEIGNAAFINSMQQLDPFKDASDNFIYAKTQDAWDAVEVLREQLNILDQKESGVVSDEYTQDVFGEPAEESVYRPSGPRLTKKEGAAAINYTKRQLEESFRIAQLVAMTLEAEGRARTARLPQEMSPEERAYREFNGIPVDGPADIKELDVNMMTTEEKLTLKENALRVINDYTAPEDDRAEAEIILKQIGKVKREYNRRSPEEIAAERERFKVLYEIEDLIYEGTGPSLEKAMKLADSLGEITLYSMDGKLWHDNPEKVAEAGGDKYKNILKKAQDVASNPKKSWDGIPPSIKSITLPYWEFYKRSGKARVNGVQMYRLGSNVKEIVKDTEEYWDLYNNEYHESGGVEPEWVDKYSGKRPDVVVRKKKSPYELELNKRARNTGETSRKIKVKRKLIGEIIGAKPTIHDVLADITNKISFPEILADIRDNYIGFSGPLTISYNKFDEMRQTGQAVAPPPMRRRRSARDFGHRIEPEKETRKGMGRSPSLRNITPEESAQLAVEELRRERELAGKGAQARTAPAVILTPEEQAFKDYAEETRRFLAGAPVPVAPTATPSVPAPTPPETQAAPPPVAPTVPAPQAAPAAVVPPAATAVTPVAVAEKAVTPPAATAVTPVARAEKAVTPPAETEKPPSPKKPRPRAPREVMPDKSIPKAYVAEEVAPEAKPAPEVVKETDTTPAPALENSETVDRAKPNAVIEGDTFDANDPRWATPDPTSKPETGPVRGPSTNSIIKPNLPETGTTTIYSTNGMGWAMDKAAAEKFGGEVTEVTLPNSTINKFGALSRKSGTLYFKRDTKDYMTPKELGAESESPVRTYRAQPAAEAPQGQAAPEQKAQQKTERGPLPEFITLYSIGGNLWHPDKEWVSKFGEVQEATIPTRMASEFGRKVNYRGKKVLAFPIKGKSIRDLEVMANDAKPKFFRVVPEGRTKIEREGKSPIVAPTLVAANELWKKMSKKDRDSAVLRGSDGSVYTLDDLEQTLKAKKSGASLPIPAGRMMVVGPNGYETPAASVRGAHYILGSMPGALRAKMRVRDEAGNLYTPAQIQNFTDRINAGEKAQKPETKEGAQQTQAEKAAETKINIDAENIRQAIIQIAAAMNRAKAAKLRAEAEAERLANAPARAEAEKILNEMKAKRAAATAKFREILDRVGMKNVRVELVRTIVGESPGDVVEGVYDPNKAIIKIAEDVWHPDMSLNDFVDQVSGVLAHELIHHMKKVNAFSKTEWATLVKHAKNTKARDRSGKLSMTFTERASVLYRDETLTKERVPEQIASIEEEGVADSFRDFLLNGAEAPPIVKGLFRRILGWIRGLFVYKSAAANKVFENILSGKYDDAAYNIQATGPQNAQTFSIAQKFKVTREQRRAAEQAKRAWREQEARTGGLTLEPRGTSEGYRQGRGSMLNERRREAMERVAEEARKASEDAKRMREKYAGRRTWIGTETSPTLVKPNPPPAIKFSRTGVYLDYMQNEAETITELAGAGPNSTSKYYSFSIMGNQETSLGQIHGMVDESNPSVFYVMSSNLNLDSMSPDDTIAMMQMLRSNLGPDVSEIRGVGEKVDETFKEYKKATEDMLSRYAGLVNAVRRAAYERNDIPRDEILEYANFLESNTENAGNARDVGDMLFDRSTDDQVGMIERLEKTSSAVSKSLSDLLRADARRMEVNRVAVAQQVGLKYAKYNLNPKRIKQVQNQEVYAAAANMVRVGLTKAGFSSQTANWAQKMADEAIQRLQDKLLPLGRIVDELRKNGLDLPSEMDAYHRYNTMRDRTADRIRVMQEQVVTPLLDMIRTNINFNKNDVESLRQVAPRFAEYVEEASSLNKGFAEAYAAAMHAPERNAVGAQRNINGNDPADPFASGFDTNEALDAQRWFMAHRSFPEISKIHRAMMRMVAYINALRHAYHLSPDWDLVKHGEQFAAAGYPDGFKNYVPLRGIGDEDTDIDPSDPNDKDIAEGLRVGKGISTQYREDRAFLGRGSRVDSVTGQVVLNRPPPLMLEHLSQMGFQAAIRGEKNFVGHGIMRLLSTFGGENIDQYGRPVKLNKMFEIIYDAPIERRLVNGVVKEVQNRDYKNEKNVFVTKVRQPDGNIKEVVIKINDAMLSRALVGTNGYGSEDASKILGFIAPYTRLLGELSTKYNPLFPLTNFPRDLAGAMINLSQHQIDGLATKVFKQMGPSFRAMWRYQTHMGLDYLKTGKERARREFIGPDGTNWTELIDLYQANGGSFDLFATSTIDDLRKEINEMIAPDPSNLGQTKRAMQRVGNLIEAYNKAVENSIRLSTFKSMMDEGIDIDTAVRAAKNVTTNYSMGGTWKSNVTALWMFFNANIQGNMQIAAALARSQRVRNIVGAVMVAGFMQDMIMSMLAGEDDETGENKYDQIPDYILQNKMIFVDPTGASENGFLSLAMPYGYNGAHNAGRALSRLIRGRYEVQDAVGTTVGTIVDAFNPLGASSSLLNFAAPTLADPIVDLYLNTDWAGRNIHPKTNPFQPDIPLSQRHWNNTGEISKMFANVLHEIGGGTPMREGKFLGVSTEVSPDALDYLFKYYLGGVGATIGQVASFLTGTIPRAISGEEVEVREIPIISKFAGNIGSSLNTEKFFNIMDESKIADMELKKAIDSQDFDAIREAMLTNRDMLQFSGVAKAIGSARSAIMSKIRQVENNKTIPDERKRQMTDPMKERVKQLERNLIKQYNMRIRDAKVQ